MVGNLQTAETGRDDLDLIQLLQTIFLYFKTYGRWMTVFSTIGVMAAISLYKVSPRLYESTLLLHSSTLTNSEQINIIENWNALLKDGRYEILGRQLNCNPGTLKKLAKMSAAEMQKLYVPNNPNAFVVTALVKDNSILDSLSNGIVYGFEHNEYIKAKLDSRRSNLVELIGKVKIEINKLDSTKDNIENSIRTNSGRPSGFIFDVSTINGQLIGLNEKLLSYQDELKFCNAVQVYHKFEKFEKPVAPKLIKLVVLFFIGGFLVGYCCLCFCTYAQD